MKILVAVDGSPESHATLAALVQRVGWFADKTDLTLIHVHPPLPHGAAASWVGKKTLQRYYEDESDLVLGQYKTLLDGGQIAYSTERKVGDPAEEIVMHAQTHGFDLIAMGTHGHSALGNFVTGSVTTKVIAAATKVPVMILK